MTDPYKAIMHLLFKATCKMHPGTEWKMAAQKRAWILWLEFFSLRDPGSPAATAETVAQVTQGQ